MPEDAQTPQQDEKQDGSDGKDSEAPAGKDGAPDYKADADKWKAMSRKHEAQAKLNAGAAEKLAEIEEANKTEAQKAADKATLSDQAAADAKQELARLRVAMRKGLTEAQAKRLIGATEEELEADADELLASFTTKDASDGDKPSTRPKEKLKSGSTNAEELSSDPQQIARDYYANAGSKPDRK